LGTCSTSKTSARKRAADILPVIQSIRADGVITLVGIAAALNARSIPAPRGGIWSSVQVSRVESPTRPKPSPAPADDDTLIRLADEQTLAVSYPDASAADAALAQQLALLTGDRARIERLMHQSALAREEWYVDGGTYLQAVIEEAMTRELRSSKGLR
jgi:hypothetical protein